MEQSRCPPWTLTAAGFEARGRSQELTRIELPLALPHIITGIRVATVTTIGLVTVAAIIGKGGLGDLILDGLRLAYWTPMIVGAVLSVALALSLDLALWLVGRALTPWARRGRVR